MGAINSCLKIPYPMIRALKIVDVVVKSIIEIWKKRGRICVKIPDIKGITNAMIKRIACFFSFF
jgi:hypothetical protein